MKKTLLFIFLLACSFQSFSQNPHTLFLTYARSAPEPVYMQRLDGAAGYKAVGSHSFGIRYLLPGRKIVTLETGIEYNDFHYRLHSVNMPDVVIPDVTESVRIISIPVYARLTFLKYLFVNGGVLLDAELSKSSRDLDKQTVIGFGIGLGGKYSYKNFHVFVNPTIERHGLIAMKKGEQGSRRGVFNPGVRIGIGYSF